MTIDVLIPVPPQVQRAAWDCAVDLDHPEHFRLAPPMSRGLVRWAARGAPERLDWAQCGELLRAHARWRAAL